MTDFTEAIQDLQKANRKIKRSTRYACGLEDEGTIREERADFFFSSPDGQNGRLFWELKNLGWINSGYKAEYFWGVSKLGVHIQYTEGDIYIRPLSAVKNSNVRLSA